VIVVDRSARVRTVKVGIALAVVGVALLVAVTR
jgi:hypothetical protein